MITVKMKDESKCTMAANQIQDGKAYVQVNGLSNIIYIGNRFHSPASEITIYAFSICGKYLVTNRNQSEFVEVDLHITVTPKSD